MEEDVVVGHDDFSKELAEKLGSKFINLDVHNFPDNEIRPTLQIKTEDEVKGKSVLIVSRTDRNYPTPNDALVELGLTADNLSELGAPRIDVLMPYIFYARQHGVFQMGEPASFSSFAKFCKNLGVSNIITLNSHLYSKTRGINGFFENVKTHDLPSSKIFAEYLKTKNLKNPVVISPGARRMNEELSGYLNAGHENLEKPRDHKTGDVEVPTPTLRLKNRDVVVYDDIVESGGTIEPTYRLVKSKKPRKVYIAVTHLLTMGGVDRLCGLGADEVITTDSLNSNDLGFTQLPTVPLFSDYIRKL